MAERFRKGDTVVLKDPHWKVVAIIDEYSKDPLLVLDHKGSTAQTYSSCVERPPRNEESKPNRNDSA